MTVSITLPAGLVGLALEQKGEHDDLSSLLVAALVTYLDLHDRFDDDLERALTLLLAHPEVLDDHHD